jgi:hypothetical protein
MPPNLSPDQRKINRGKWFVIACVLLTVGALGVFRLGSELYFGGDRVSCDSEVAPARWSEQGVEAELRQRIAVQADDCETLNGYTSEEVRRALGKPNRLTKPRHDWVYLAGQGGRYCWFQSDTVHMVIRFGEGDRVRETYTYCT